MATTTRKTRLTAKIRARRVAVARDVLEQLRIEKLNAAVGSYLTGLPGKHDAIIKIMAKAEADGQTDLQCVVDKVAPKCRVCARGAILLSKARLFNAVPIGSLVKIGWFGKQYVSVEQEETTDLLADTFDPLTLAMIEGAFELKDMTDGEFDEADEDRIRRAVEFGEAIAKGEFDAKARIIATMENIIANNGVFKP